VREGFLVGVNLLLVWSPPRGFGASNIHHGASLRGLLYISTHLQSVTTVSVIQSREIQSKVVAHDEPQFRLAALYLQMCNILAPITTSPGSVFDYRVPQFPCFLYEGESTSRFAVATNSYIIRLETFAD